MNRRFRVLIADAISSEGLQPLHDDARFEVFEKTGLKGDELARAIKGMDAVIVRSATRITRASLSDADCLKVIGRAGVGVDTIDVEAATERGVAVLNAPSGNTISAAELAFALLLALVRSIPRADRSMKDGEWDRKSFNGTELYGKVLGLVGAGRIGGEVARRARAFGMRVICYDPFLTPERANTLEVELTTLADVLKQSDVLSLHVPLTEATAGMIGEAELEMVKPGAYLVNAARGGVVDERALLRMLEQKRLAGAALDVFEEEPMPADHPLRRAPNIVLTPHVGASTTEAQQNVALEIAEAVRAALLEGDLSRAVNAPALSGEAMRKVRPLLELGERLGRLAAALAEQPVQRVDIRYAGALDEAIRPLGSSVLVGVLAPVLGQSAVNFVNALHLAETRGITVERARVGRQRDYTELIEVRLASRQAETIVAGSLLAEAHPRVVRIDGFHIDLNPRGTLVVIRNRDVPGVIGRVGTVLGNANVNIAEYHQARLEAGGDALAAISVDGRLQPDVLAELRKLAEVVDVRQAELD
jgi:D-3-phosphoglycerate dehydrogenase / 2-oxoglutarate reductase